MYFNYFPTFFLLNIAVSVCYIHILITRKNIQAHFALLSNTKIICKTAVHLNNNTSINKKTFALIYDCNVQCRESNHELNWFKTLQTWDPLSLWLVVFYFNKYYFHIQYCFYTDFEYSIHTDITTYTQNTIWLDARWLNFRWNNK